MIRAHDDSKEVCRAKELASGDLGHQLSIYPMRFAAGVFIGPTRRSLPFPSNSATATLLRLQGRPLAVTCSHVIERYRSRPIHSEPGFWIGSLQLDPLERLITEDRQFDIGVVDLSGLDLSLISEGGEIGSAVVDPATWPPVAPTPGDFICFGGFPGIWRQQPRLEEVVFKSFSHGASEVTSVGENYVVCHLNRDYWVSCRGTRGLDLYAFGGMSGGPAFIWRGLGADLVGFIYQYSDGLDMLYIRSAHVIGADGTIR
jgi:hypothetical protein